MRRHRNARSSASSAPILTLNARFRWDVIDATVRRGAPTSILEFGPGSGAVAARLARMAVYVGVEPDETSRNRALAAVAGTSALVVSSPDEVDRGAKFDLVCAFEVLEHVPDDAAALRTFADHLAPEGRILLSMPAHRDRFGPWDDRVGHLRRYDRVDVVDLVDRAGLRLTGLWSTGWPMGRLLEQGRNLVARMTPGAGSADQRSAASGRLLQPRRCLGLVFALLSPPMVWLHRRGLRSGRGTGWVIECAAR